MINTEYYLSTLRTLDTLSSFVCHCRSVLNRFIFTVAPKQENKQTWGSERDVKQETLLETAALTPRCTLARG